MHRYFHSRAYSSTSPIHSAFPHFHIITALPYSENMFSLLPRVEAR
jgi:hypothetical protein